MQPQDGDKATVEGQMAEHAAYLTREGVGAMSLMCRQSILHTMNTIPSMPEIHAREGAKFAALAYRIAPPRLVATYLRSLSAHYPPVVVLEAGSWRTTLQKTVRITEPPGTIQALPRPTGAAFRYTQADNDSYLRYCASQPDLLLACVYLTIALQRFCHELSETLEPQLQRTVRLFGAQFNALNLTTALPVAICLSALQSKGENATTEQIDGGVIESGLRFLHEMKLFTSEADARPAGAGRTEVAVLQCPMEGYVFDLFLKQDGFKPTLQATTRIDRDCRAKSASADPRRQSALQLHETNRQNIFAAVTFWRDTAVPGTTATSATKGGELPR